jgi:hypothetical protein
MDQETDHQFVTSSSTTTIAHPISNTQIGKYCEMFPDRDDAKVKTGYERKGWWLSIWYGLEYDESGQETWDISHLLEGRETEKYVLDDVLEMFDYAEDGYWTPLSNMDDSDDEDDGGEEDDESDESDDDDEDDDDEEDDEDGEDEDHNDGGDDSDEDDSDQDSSDEDEDDNPVYSDDEEDYGRSNNYGNSYHHDDPDYNETHGMRGITQGMRQMSW